MTDIPQCLQCGSYTGKMENKDFRCKSCGCMTEQPEEIWKKDSPSTEANPSALTDEKDLILLLEAYDTGSHPFNVKSEARDLYEQLDGIFDTRLDEELHEAKKALEEEKEEEAYKYLAERKQVLIEAVRDACEPHLRGLGQDIVALIEEYIE